MKLLLHTCCAPCSVYCIDELRSENIEPTVYWFNPNIHPYMEYKARRDCLKEYTKSIGIKAIFEEDYGLKEFCKNVIDDLENRCVNYCYRVRLEQTAKFAKENGYDSFSTTLLVSPYQNHEALKHNAKGDDDDARHHAHHPPGSRFAQCGAVHRGFSFSVSFPLLYAYFGRETNYLWKDTTICGGSALPL